MCEWVRVGENRGDSIVDDGLEDGALLIGWQGNIDDGHTVSFVASVCGA